MIGEIRQKLTSILLDAQPTAQIINSDLTEMVRIVDLAKSLSINGDVVILSPGCGSFDMFKDFYDRGDQFREAVNKL